LSLRSAPRPPKRVGQDDADQQEPRQGDELGVGTKALATVHPSYLLRLPDAESKERDTSASSTT